ncbi:MAG: YIP1 family protein [Anaerolineae bacterium]
MEIITTTFRQAIDALLLRDSAYRSMRESPSPFVRGLVFIVSIGVIVALVSIVGAILLRLTSPNLGAIQETVWEGMQDMPWVEQIPPGDRVERMQQVRQSFDLGWQIARQFTPGIGSAILNVILNPISLVLGWLVYGLLAFLAARALGGTGRLDQTYGTTALAAAPRILGVVNVVPYVETAGLGIWALICNYLALKNTHDLSPWRAFWATVVPLVLLFLFVVGLAILGVVIAVTVSGGGS